MDVLYFVKEEYAALKAGIPGLVGGDASLQDDDLKHFLKRVSLMVRISDELILPELAEYARKGLEALAEAGDQTTELTKIVNGGLKGGKLGEARRRDLGERLAAHLDCMERQILPKFREEISTQAREDLGLVALDFKADLSLGAQASIKAEARSGQ